MRTASRSAQRTLSALVTAGLAAALVAPAAASASPQKHPSSHKQRSADKHSSIPPATVGFAVPTVVDQFRPGFEPDNAVAPEVKGDPYSGSTFVSMPNGFSTTMSYVWRSDDGNQTFHPTEGNVFGKPTTCVGGGDTELQIDPVNGDVYLADLQGLTNFSTSASSDGGHTWNTTCAAVPGIGVDRQWEAIDDNGGTSAVGPGPNGGRLYFDYDNVDQDATGSGNQLVMNESLDGVHFGAYCQGGGSGGTTASGCPAPPAMISPNESIPGNVIVDNIPGNPYQHRVFAIHTGDNGSSVVLSYCSGAKGDNTAAEVAQDCTDPTAFTPGQNPNDPMDRTNRYWHDVYVQKPGSYSTGNLFPSIAIDRAGNLYTVWSQYPTGSAGVDGPGAIMMSVSTNGGSTWSAPTPISQSGINEAVMPWIVAGDAGRVGVAYYAANDTIDGSVGPDASNRAVWNLFYAFSTHALDSADFTYTQVNEPGHPIKFGDISTGGLGGVEDRSLGDFFQVHAGPQGQAVISYVDDTSADRNADTCGGCGETPPEAAGPVMVATQNRGPSLYAGAAIPATPTNDQGSVSVPAAQAAKSAFLAAAGQDVAAAANQQLTGARVTSDGTNLTVTLTTADPHLANDLSVSPTLGGEVANWMVRWAAPSYSEQSTNYTNCPGTGSVCDGNIFYVGMESDSGGSPSFYYGSTQALTTTHAKYFEYPASDTADLSAKITGSSIQWTLPLKDVGAPAAGQGLYSVTGFTSTQLQPSPSSTASVPANNGEVGDANIPNLIAATPPFDYLIGSSTAGGDVPEAPYAILLVLIPLGGASVWMLRRRSSTRKVTA